MDNPMRANHSEGVDGQSFPYRESLRTWAGHGTGAVCNGCGDAIQGHEIEYEIELPPGSTAPKLHFHFTCYRTWTGRGAR